MFFLIIGVLVVILGIASRTIPNLARYGRGLILAGIIMVVVGISLKCFVQIDAGYVGVKKLFGKVQPEVLNSGLHFVNPSYPI